MQTKFIIFTTISQCHPPPPPPSLGKGEGYFFGKICKGGGGVAEQLKCLGVTLPTWSHLYFFGGGGGGGG